MHRKPSIHITESKLAKLLQEVLEVEGSPIVYPYKDIAKEIVRLAQPHSLINRTLTVSNDKLDKKVTQLVKASTSDTQLLANLIYHIRRRKTKHYTQMKVDPNSREYGQLKELTNICIGFCNDFGFSKREGFIKYLELSIPKINSSLNFINKLVNMAEKVYSTQEAINIILEDKNSKETREIYDLYSKLIIEQNGLNPNYDKDPTLYKYFVDVREKTDELDIPADIYIKAQFHGLLWTDSYPEPQHLIGDKAIARLSKYMYENKIKVKQQNAKKDLSYADKLKALKKK